jgi:hypothetical protein
MNLVGINASQLVSMVAHAKSKGNRAMKIVLVNNGMPMNPMDCETIDISINEDTMTISWDAKESAPAKDLVATASAPSSHGIIYQDDNEIYHLTGEDLANYVAQSRFLKDDMKSDKTTGAQEIVIETSFYDILELDSVTDAVRDLIAQETLYLSNGARVVKNEVPRYIYG